MNGDRGSQNVSSGMTIMEPGAGLPMHFHDTEECITCVEGEAMCSVDGEVLRLRPFDHIWIAEGSHHRFWNEGTEVDAHRLDLRQAGGHADVRRLRQDRASHVQRRCRATDVNDPAVRPRRAAARRSEVFEWGARTFVMGVLNVTPDSFSGDGVANDAAALRARIDALLDAAPDIIDVGGESTRPGAAEVPTDEEIGRVAPALEALRSARPRQCRFPSIRARPPWRAPLSIWAR